MTSPAKRRLSAARGLAGATLSSFSRHGGRMLGGAIAFYALLSFAPLLVIALHIAGLLTSEAHAQRAVLDDLSRWIGREGARTMAAILERVRTSPSGGLASVLSGAVLVYGATRLFSQLQVALNLMWDVQLKGGGDLKVKARRQLQRRGLSVLMVVFVGVVILGLVLYKALLHAAASQMGVQLRGSVLLQVSEIVGSFAILTALFFMVFKVLPDVRLDFRDAFLGALMTALLFSAGNVVIGLYLGHKAVASTYGAAGSVVALLLWVHYSAQIFFVGAAFTGELARRHGGGLAPTSHARRVLLEHDEEEDGPAP